MHLLSSTWQDTAPQHACKQKENLPIGRGVDGVRRPLRPWMTEKAHETDASYPHPRGATMGRSRRLVPTAARTAAPGLGPSNGGQVVTPSPHGY